MNGTWDYKKPDFVRWAEEVAAGIWEPNLREVVKREIRQSGSTHRSVEHGVTAGGQDQPGH